ncbi:MAG TPA: ribosome maturation factor, partial [Clostridiales bacterium]|nr:ribosome maturation factor [Clostridiales bacterium]
MSNKKQNTASQVRALVEKPISEMGFSLWDVAYYKEGAELILEVSVDKKGGISLDDCSDITKKIEPIID